MAELERRELEGELIRVSAVEKDAQALAVILKNALLDIADRIASIVASETDEKKVYKIIDTEIRSCLDRVSSKKR
jgi:hypothetical protein